jgi:hypothetical protein
MSETGMTEESLACADAKGNDRSRLGKIPVDPIRNAGPILVEAIVKNDDAAVSQSAVGGGEIVRGYISRMPTVDTDQAEQAATKLQQLSGGQLRGISLMNDEPFRVRMAEKIPLEAFQIARA